MTDAHREIPKSQLPRGVGSTGLKATTHNPTVSHEARVAAAERLAEQAQKEGYTIDPYKEAEIGDIKAEILQSTLDRDIRQGDVAAAAASGTTLPYSAQGSASSVASSADGATMEEQIVEGVMRASSNGAESMDEKIATSVMQMGRHGRSVEAKEDQGVGEPF
ncbi:hypothetical protein SeMB42_g06991 [Synchytrium endobioticum]|uniref:SMP domain-containing protein n=1 Tax=Synchytrium endobioticum TaxID=286115 RepID=A0A507CC15_9FUNG|nr:hypothetical protein SeMB42_g06991 [Synchytrium endobioticum]